VVGVGTRYVPFGLRTHHSRRRGTKAAHRHAVDRL